MEFIAQTQHYKFSYYFPDGKTKNKMNRDRIFVLIIVSSLCCMCLIHLRAYTCEYTDVHMPTFSKQGLFPSLLKRPHQHELVARH